MAAGPTQGCPPILTTTTATTEHPTHSGTERGAGGGTQKLEGRKYLRPQEHHHIPSAQVPGRPQMRQVLIAGSRAATGRRVVERKALGCVYRHHRRRRRRSRCRCQRRTSCTLECRRGCSDGGGSRCGSGAARARVTAPAATAAAIGSGPGGCCGGCRPRCHHCCGVALALTPCPTLGAGAWSQRAHHNRPHERVHRGLQRGAARLQGVLHVAVAGQEHALRGGWRGCHDRQAAHDAGHHSGDIHRRPTVRVQHG